MIQYTTVCNGEQIVDDANVWKCFSVDPYSGFDRLPRIAIAILNGSSEKRQTNWFLSLFSNDSYSTEVVRSNMMLDYNYSVGLVTGVSIGLLSGYLLRKNILSKLFGRESTSFSGVLDAIKTMSKSSKLVLVVRDDLKMGKGKIAAQCSHASVMAYCKAKKKQTALLKQWELTGQMKVVLRCENDVALFELKKQAEQSGLLTSLVCDAGHTQVAPSTYTVLAIGPANKEALDKITGHLKLLWGFWRFKRKILVS